MYHNFVNKAIMLILLLVGLLTGCASIDQGCLGDGGRLVRVERNGQTVATVCAKGD